MLASVYTAGMILGFWLFALLIGALIWMKLDADNQVYDRDHLTRIALSAWIALLVLEPLLFVIWTASVSGMSIRTILPMLPRVLVVTHFGHAMLTRWLALAALGLVLRQQLRWQLVIWACACLVVFAWSHSVTGHAGDLSDYIWPVWVDSLHFLVTTAWAGSVLLAAWRPHTHDFADYAYAIQKLSLLAAVLLTTVVITGIANAVHMLRVPANLLDSGYGRLLDWKLLAVAVVVLLAAVNRYLLLPQLVISCGVAPLRGPLREWMRSRLVRHGPVLPAGRAASALRLSFAMEAAILLLALSLAGILRQSMPPVPHM